MTNTSSNSLVASPPWAVEIKQKFLGREASMFIVHGNVHDEVLTTEKGFVPASRFVRQSLLAPTKNVIKLSPDSSEENRARFFTKLAESMTALSNEQGHAFLVDYADILFPEAPSHFLSEEDRERLVALHRAAIDPAFQASDHIIVLMSESMTAPLNRRLVRHPGVAHVQIELPSEPERDAAIRLANSRLSDAEVKTLARQTAGLRVSQLRHIVSADSSDGPGEEERTQLISSMLDGQPNAAERAKKLASMTGGLDQEQIRALINPNAEPDQAVDVDPLKDVMDYVQVRKKELIEQECAGLIEFVESKHGLEAVGGMEEVKRELAKIAEDVKSGHAARTPKGLMFVGAMGSGKTFIAKCFSRSSGLPAVVLKNFRDRWVGSTEANLERVLDTIKALGPIILIIDEGDRAFGSASGESDGGTSSRVIARIKAFMSDPANRGKVLFIIMTNRPDKMDVDLKRAGRIDRKIPLFYPENGMPKAYASFTAEQLDQEIVKQRAILAALNQL